MRNHLRGQAKKRAARTTIERRALHRLIAIGCRAQRDPEKMLRTTIVLQRLSQGEHHGQMDAD